jgi:5-methylcytosine-specific restriction endonuclease McrA
MNSHAHPTLPSAAASIHGAATPSLALLEARQVRDSLKLLLRKEQAAMADFLVALSDFDRRLGWEPLGHANLFAFLHVELRLSKSAAFYRKSAAELLQDFPEVIEPLRDGRMCLSTIAELAKVLTVENRAVVPSRFFGLSSREAQELVAELQPREVPSTRMVVTRVLNRSASPPAKIAQPLLTFALAPQDDAHPTEVPPSRVLTSDFANGGGGRPVARRDEIVPLTADLRRVHFNVGKAVVRKLEAAREGLSHSIRGATMEQVLDVALDLLLEKQARSRGQVKRPRKTVAANPAGTPANHPAAAAQPTPATTSPSTSHSIATEPPRHRRDGPREAIPASVRRAVWARDQGRCAWPLDSGGVCGSTHQLELDHIDPWARWGEPTKANLRVVCHSHNAMAARRAFGARCVERYARRRGGGET